MGVIGVRGSFQVGDSVSLCDPEGVEIGRGLVRMSAPDAARAAGNRELANNNELIHRDDLVIFGRSGNLASAPSRC